MKPATRSLVFAVLAVLCLTVAVRNPVSAASQIPIRGTLTVVEGTYPNSFTAVGILTGLGPVTMTSALGFPFAHLTLTTRSGEQLQASALFLSFPSFGIDGGTGRFEGADGFLDLSTVDGTKVGVQGTLILNP